MEAKDLLESPDPKPTYQSLCPVCKAEMKVDKSHDDYNLLECCETCEECGYCSEWAYGSGAEFIGGAIIYEHWNDSRKVRDKREEDRWRAIRARREALLLARRLGTDPEDTPE